jgi:hypothetical protein
MWDQSLPKKNTFDAFLRFACLLRRLLKESQMRVKTLEMEWGIMRRKEGLRSPLPSQ